MIIDISDKQFRKIFDNEQFYLPIRWDGTDFAITLENLFNKYIRQVEGLDIKSIYDSNDMKVYIKKIKRVCGLLVKSVSHYLNGFPSKAYTSFNNAMEILMDNPLEIYQKSVIEQFENSGNPYNYDDPLNLFRIVSVDDNKPSNRARVFHTPYNMRSKVSTCRYSIAGYPSLYLGTSLKLCCEEINLNPYKKFALTVNFNHFIFQINIIRNKHT